MNPEEPHARRFPRSSLCKVGSPGKIKYIPGRFERIPARVRRAKLLERKRAVAGVAGQLVIAMVLDAIYVSKLKRVPRYAAPDRQSQTTIGPNGQRGAGRQRVLFRGEPVCGEREESESLCSHRQAKAQSTRATVPTRTYAEVGHAAGQDET